MAESKSKTESWKIAVVGGETLLGKDIAEVLKDRKPAFSVTSFAASGEGNFSEVEGESVYVEPLEAAIVKEQQAIVLGGSAEGARKAYGLVKAAGGKPVVIDCSGYLENEPEARIAAPPLAGPKNKGGWLWVTAHPAATALALALKRLARYRMMRQAIAHVFEPASERGRKGISELHQQTTGLLAFKPLEKELFDAQLSFNLLAQLGEDAPQSLLSVEQRIERHLATLLGHATNGEAVPMPSLRLIQAPVFHGYSISLWVEFETDITVQGLGEALASAQIEVRAADEEAPNSVGAAGQSGWVAGDIRADSNNARAAWVWLTGDNLRATADAAAAILADLREGGK